jgi:hypothetical protein
MKRTETARRRTSLSCAETVCVTASLTLVLTYVEWWRKKVRPHAAAKRAATRGSAASAGSWAAGRRSAGRTATTAASSGVTNSVLTNRNCRLE